MAAITPSTTPGASPRSPEGISSFHQAILEKRVDDVASFLAQGADPRDLDKKGRTALHVAAEIKLESPKDKETTQKILNMLADHGGSAFEIGLKKYRSITALKLAEEKSGELAAMMKSAMLTL